MRSLWAAFVQVAVIDALPPAEVVRTLCRGRTCPGDMLACWRPQPLAAYYGSRSPPPPATGAMEGTVDEAQHARRCELATGFCTTLEAGLWDLVAAHWPRDQKLVVADVGANKDFFSSRALALFAPRCGVDPNLVRGAVCAYLKSRAVEEEAEGPCNTLFDSAPLVVGGTPCGRGAQVHSFEPSPPLYGMATTLQRAVFAESRPAWRWHRAALADYEGSSTFHAVWHEGSALQRRIDGGRRLAAANDSRVVVPVTTLDAWAARHGVEHLGLVKIDAEGHDLAVVDGASRLLREGRIVLLIWKGAQRWPDAAKRLDGDLYRGPEAYFAALARLGMDCYLLSRGRHLLLAGTTAARLGQVPCPYAGAVENWTNPAVAAALGRKPCRRAPQVGEGCTDPAKLRSRAVRRFRQARSYHLRRQPIENYACVRRSHALGRAFLEHSLAYQIFSDDRNSAAGGPVDAATLMTSRLRPL